VKVRGVELAVSESSPPRTVLWGHGLLSSMQAEDAVGLFRWSDGPGYRVVRYDARGHGRSVGTTEAADYRWPSLAADMLGVADGLGEEQFVAAGASMGASTSLHAALAAPERVLALVLVIPPTAWGTRATQARMYRSGARLVETVGLTPFIAMMRAAPVAGIFGEDLRFREAGLAALGSADRKVVAKILRGAADSDLPDQEQLASLTMPALILAWQHDPGHPVSTAKALARVLPNAQLHQAGSLTAVRTWPGLVADFLTGALRPSS